MPRAATTGRRRGPSALGIHADRRCVHERGYVGSAAASSTRREPPTLTARARGRRGAARPDQPRQVDDDIGGLEQRPQVVARDVGVDPLGARRAPLRHPACDPGDLLDALVAAERPRDGPCRTSPVAPVTTIRRSTPDCPVVPGGNRQERRRRALAMASVNASRSSGLTGIGVVAPFAEIPSRRIVRTRSQ